MNITANKLEHLAKLSRLVLTDDQKQRLLKEMNGIIDFANKLNEVDVSSINPTVHATDMIYNVFRQDEPKESMPREKILENAPEADDSCFLVIKAVE